MSVTIVVVGVAGACIVAAVLYLILPRDEDDSGGRRPAPTGWRKRPCTRRHTPPFGCGAGRTGRRRD
jgi:hypothetical protein